jgi:Rieske Fe-S protein
MTIEQPLSRRHVLAAGAVGVGALALTGCSSDKAKDAGSPTPAAPSPSASSSASGGTSGGSLAKLADIPVGGSVAGKGPDGRPALFSQPTAGTVVAFSAICTHKGCTVAPAGKELHCPCHGSKYNAATGEVLGGPAPRPLSKIDVHVASGEVVAGSA